MGGLYDCCTKNMSLEGRIKYLAKVRGFHS